MIHILKFLQQHWNARVHLSIGPHNTYFWRYPPSIKTQYYGQRHCFCIPYREGLTPPLRLTVEGIMQTGSHNSRTLVYAFLAKYFMMKKYEHIQVLQPDIQTQVYYMEH